MHRRFASLVGVVATLAVACSSSPSDSSGPTPPSGPTAPGTTPSPPPSTAWPVVTHSGTIEGPPGTGAVWAARTIHRITSNLQVRGALTIEAPAIVEVDGTYEVLVFGRLFARGTPSAPIEWRPRTSGATWAGIRMLTSIDGPNVGISDAAELDLRHVTLRGCGGTPTNVFQPGSPPACLLLSLNSYHFESVTVDGSAGFGVYVSNGAATSTSRGLTVRGAAREPLGVTSMFMGLLPAELSLGENLARPWVSVTETGAPRGRFTDGRNVARIRDAGVPYLLDNLSMGANVLATDNLIRANRVIVDPGVQMRFARRGILRVGQGDGAASAIQLQLLGTSERPIILAPQNPTALWCGLRFESAARGNTHTMTHVVIDGAGAGAERDPVDGSTCRFDGALSVAGGPVSEYQFDVARQPGIVTRLDARHVRIRNWGSAAGWFGQGALFTDSSRVFRVEQGQGVAISTTEPNLLPTLPDSLFITGGLDAVVRVELFPPVGQCPRTVTVSGRWPPADYVLRNGHYLQSIGHVDIRANRITLDPNRALIFGGGDGMSCALQLGLSGTGTVRGTLQSRLVIQSSSPTAAHGGIVFAGPADTGRERVDYVDVTRASFSFGGRTSAIRVRGEGRGGFITNVRVTDGAGCGIARERGSGVAFTTDFLASSLTNQVSGHTPAQCSF